jgi:glyoxylase-like metal-dependent hydrolase (beta-lactamase superfamily II)
VSALSPTAPSLIAPEIWRIELPTPWAVGSVNVYLIVDDPLTLIDTGPLFDPARAVLEASLESIGYGLEQLRRVIVTHQHLDHGGMAHLLAERSGAELCALDALVDWFATYPASIESEDEFAERVLRRHGASDQALAALAEFNRDARGHGAPATITMPVFHGDVLEFGTRRLQVLHRPGHSPSDTVFHDAERRTLFGGDHLLAHVRSSALLAPPLDGAEVHVRPRAFVRYLESLATTEAMDLELILPGHGDPITDHGALIESRLSRYRVTAERLASLLGPEPRTASQLAVAMRPHEGENVSFSALCDVLGHLDLLLEQGVAIEYDGLIKRFALRGGD